jgi:DNA invertase Pin-like site-specific DNA recombinase
VAHRRPRRRSVKRRELDRSGLTQALDLSREGKIDLLLVYRVDRLSRKVRQLAQLAEELDRLGVVLRSATEPFDTGSAAGRMMLQMLGVSRVRARHDRRPRQRRDRTTRERRQVGDRAAAVRLPPQRA